MRVLLMLSSLLFAACPKPAPPPSWKPILAPRGDEKSAAPTFAIAERTAVAIDSAQTRDASLD
jgi:hypothetical protein